MPFIPLEVEGGGETRPKLVAETELIARRHGARPRAVGDSAGSINRQALDRCRERAGHFALGDVVVEAGPHHFVAGGRFTALAEVMRDRELHIPHLGTVKLEECELGLDGEVPDSVRANDGQVSFVVGDIPDEGLGAPEVSAPRARTGGDAELDDRVISQAEALVTEVTTANEIGVGRDGNTVLGRSFLRMRSRNREERDEDGGADSDPEEDRFGRGSGSHEWLL